VAVYLLLGGTGLDPAARLLAGATTLMAIWWVTEALPIGATSLIPLGLFPWLGILEAKQAAVHYGDNLIWLFFGGFQIAFAVERWGLHERVAMGLVRLLGTREDRLVLGFMLASAIVSMWISNTATTVMMLPVAMAVAAAVQGHRDPGPFAGAILLGVAYAASAGGMGTYVGTAPNLVFRKVAGNFGAEVPFDQWMYFAIPLAMVMVVGIWLYLTRIAFDVGRRPLPDDHPAVEAVRRDLGSWSRGEKIVAAVFFLTAAGWVLRRPMGWGALGVTDSTIAIGAVILLFVLPADREADGRIRFALEWTDAARTPWHILLLFGGGFAIADGFQRTGLSAWMGQQLATVIEGAPLFLVVLAVALFVTFLTEVTSNTATATVLLPVIGGLAKVMGVPPLILMVPATLAASCAFMLPVATPPNAIVYASGMFTMRDMARVGLWINFGTAIFIAIGVMTWGRFILPQ
jgi:sodium-dependent dicarboxylate transporter 2/3/5